MSCDTVHLTNFGGVLNIPTSVEELLEELKEAFTFSTFTLDEAFALLANFDFGKNVTISCNMIFFNNYPGTGPSYTISIGHPNMHHGLT